MKKYGVIDIGSNSVRAKMFSDGKILYSDMCTTRLGEGLAKGVSLTQSSIDRTVDALKKFKAEFEKMEADEVYAFATEAVRSAENGCDFIRLTLEMTGLKIDVVSGDEEGELGLLGAVGNSNGGIIDIGGASAEISIVKNKKIIYSHSLPLGAVRLYGACGEDEEKLDELISAKIPEYGVIPEGVIFRVVGGTATTIAAMDIGLEKYDADKVDGYVLTREAIERDYLLIKSFNRTQREELLHISPKRSDIIVCGAYMLKRIVENFKIEKVIVEESDNLLGYLKKRVYGESYER